MFLIVFEKNLTKFCFLRAWRKNFCWPAVLYIVIVTKKEDITLVVKISRSYEDQVEPRRTKKITAWLMRTFLSLADKEPHLFFTKTSSSANHPEHKVSSIGTFCYPVISKTTSNKPWWISPELLHALFFRRLKIFSPPLLSREGAWMLTESPSLQQCVLPFQAHFFFQIFLMKVFNLKRVSLQSSSSPAHAWAWDERAAPRHPNGH